MSYILDALRRADAERGRGAVPGLHTQAMPAPGASTGAGRALSTGALVAGAAVVAGLAGAGTWWAMQRNAPAAPVVGATAPQAPSVATAPLPVPAPAAVAVAPSPAPAPVAAAPLAPQAVEPRPVAPKRVAEPARERAAVAEPTTRARAADAPPHAAPAAPAGRAQPPAAASPSGPVFAQSDLPPSVREQLPALQVSGATYSSNPAHRMAIVNGHVLQEGDQAAPGLVLERIEQGGRTVWSFRGYRYAVAPQ
jgi:general secretion pathway protein B